MAGEDAVYEDFEEKLSWRAHGAIPPQMLRESAGDPEQWSANLKAYPFTDPVLISTFAESAPPTIAWLKSKGVQFTYGSPMLLQKGGQRLAPSCGGLAIVEALAASAEQLGVEVRYETTGRSLLLDDRGDVCGLRAWSKEKGVHSIDAGAVVLASGGFQGNTEMLTRYVGANAYLSRPVSPGGIYNKGEGIEMALAAGAAAAGQYEMFHAEPIDPRSTRHEALVGALNYGILVNNGGQRFFDEGSDVYEYIYDEVSWTIMRQKGGIAYFLFDTKLYDVPNVRVRLRSEVAPMRASSAREMAQQLGVRPDVLEATLRSYNAAVQDGEFDPKVRDGKCAVGITPPKSNWARTIDESDLHAYPVMCANTFTCGGVKIDKDGQVLNRDGHPIPGLYAAGEMVGFYYGLYVGATSVLRGLVFGRRAGQHVAGALGR
ncbi:FAD-binding protein [Ramlibacter sp. AN1015]|uniref:FAD-binding protein n=1 Tax=Ramlibacter sp. AN1015 TaxID=3133428 RepID=UPI0030C44488